MATLFVGREQNQTLGDSLLEAAPIFEQSMQNVGQAIFAYQQQKKQDTKDELANIASVAEFSGGYSKLPQEVQNKLPRLLGVDMPKDPATGDILIQPSIDEMLRDAYRNRLMADPEQAVADARIKMGLQQKATDPAALEAEFANMQSKLETANLDRRFKWELEGVKQKNKLALAEYDRTTRIGAALARAGQKGASDKEDSGFYFDQDGSVLDPGEFAQAYGESVTAGQGLPKGVTSIKNGQLKNILTSRKDEDLATSRQMARQLTDVKIKDATEKFLAQTIEDRQLKNLLDSKYRAMQDGNQAAMNALDAQIGNVAAGIAIDNQIPETEATGWISSILNMLRSPDGMQALQAQQARRRREDREFDLLNGETPVIAPAKVPPQPRTLNVNGRKVTLTPME